MKPFNFTRSPYFLSNRGPIQEVLACASFLKCFPYFSPNNWKVASLPLRSLIHSELVLYREERQQSSLLLLPVDSSVPSIFIRTQVAYSKTVSLGPLFCFIDLCMHLCSFYFVFLTMALEYNLKWSMVIFLELFLLRIALSIWSLRCFRMNFNIFSISMNNDIGIDIW